MIANTGAYGRVMSSHYNLRDPALECLRAGLYHFAIEEIQIMGYNAAEMRYKIQEEGWVRLRAGG